MEKVLNRFFMSSQKSKGNWENSLLMIEWLNDCIKLSISISAATTVLFNVQLKNVCSSQFTDEKGF